MNKEFQPQVETGDLSHDLNSISFARKARRLSGATGLAAATILGGSSVALGEEQTQEEVINTIPSFMEIADTDNNGQLNFGEVIIGIPNYAEVMAQKAEELAKNKEKPVIEPTPKPELKNLNKLVTKKNHPKDLKLNDIKTEYLEFLEENPDTNTKLAELSKSPDYDIEAVGDVFDTCINGKKQAKKDACSSILFNMILAYGISRDPKVYEWADNLLGNTKKIQDKDSNEFILKNLIIKAHPDIFS